MRIISRKLKNMSLHDEEKRQKFALLLEFSNRLPCTVLSCRVLGYFTPTEIKATLVVSFGKKCCENV